MPDEKNIREHLHDHQKYPATKEELLENCNNLSDLNAEDRKWFEETLPLGTYLSDEDVLLALGMTS